MKATDLTKNDLEFKITYSQYIKLNVMLGWLKGNLQGLENVSSLIDLLKSIDLTEWFINHHDSLKTNLKDELEPIVMALRQQLYDLKEKNE